MFRCLPRPRKRGALHGLRLMLTRILGRIGTHARILAPEMLVKEFDDQRFHCRILEKTDPTAAGIEPPGFWIGINSEVRIVTATNNRMEMVRCVYLVHRIGQSLGLFIRNEFILCAVNDEHRRLALMYVGSWTRVAPQFLIVFVVRAEQLTGQRREPGYINRTKQINYAGNVAGLIEVISDVEQFLSAGRSN